MSKYNVHLDRPDSAGRLNDEFVHAAIGGKKINLRFLGTNIVPDLSPGIRSSLILAKSASLNIGSVEFYEPDAYVDLDKISEITRGILAHCDTLQEISFTSDSDKPFTVVGSTEILKKLIDETKNLVSFKIGVKEDKNYQEEDIHLPEKIDYSQKNNIALPLLNSLKNIQSLQEIVINTTEKFSGSSTVGLISSLQNLKSLVIPGSILSLEDLLPLGSACIHQKNLFRLFYNSILVDDQSFVYALGVDPSLKQFARKSIISKTNIATESIKDKFWVQIAKSSISRVQGFITKSDIPIENPIVDLSDDEFISILSTPSNERSQIVDEDPEIDMKISDFKKSDVLVLW